MVHSIEAYYSGLLSNHNGFMRFYNSIASLDLVTIEFRIRSLASSSAFMFAPPDPAQFASKAMQAHGILMTCSYNILILTPNGLTPD